MDLITALTEKSRDFGRRAEQEKLALLLRLELEKLSAAQSRRLRPILAFLRAHPDGTRVRQAVERLIAREPATLVRRYAYSFGVVRRLLRLAAIDLEIDWDRLGGDAGFGQTLGLLITPAELAGVEDIAIEYRDWFEHCRPREQSSLAFLLSLFERSGLSTPWQSQAYDLCDVPLVYRGPAWSRLSPPAEKVHYQRRPLDRRTFPLARVIRSPLAGIRRGDRRDVDVAVQALCSRKLEIFPLIHADPRDVTLVPAPRGLTIMLVGVTPEFRSALDTLSFVLIAKNGVPMAYGPASVCLGCCEMGINVFPEFRGAEIRFVYAQFMRALHHLLAVDYFFLTPYGMGENNPDAIASGAFWFYRKLGFRVTSPEVEALARAEEAKANARPGYRSDRRMLRRLSHTEAYFDLSGGQCRPLDAGGLGIATSRFIGREFDGDRGRAVRECTRRLARLLAMDAESRALQTVSVILAMIPDLARWSGIERRRLRAAIEAKDARSEIGAARLWRDHPRLGAALRELASSARAEGA
jgi:hypothetical protein